MTAEQKKMKKYTCAVERKLNLPRDVKYRVMNDFISGIQSRRDSGMTDGEIYEELGTPVQAAKVLNEQMKEFAYRKSPWRWLCLALGILCLLYLLTPRIISAVISFPVDFHSAGFIGGADGPTAIFVTQSPASVVQRVIVLVTGLFLSAAGFWHLSHLKRK